MKQLIAGLLLSVSLASGASAQTAEWVGTLEMSDNLAVDRSRTVITASITQSGATLTGTWRSKGAHGSIELTMKDGRNGTRKVEGMVGFSPTITAPPSYTFQCDVKVRVTGSVKRNRIKLSAPSTHMGDCPNVRWLVWTLGRPKPIAP